MAQEITLDYYPDILAIYIYIYAFQVMIKVCFFLSLIAGCCVFFKETCGGEGS